MLKPYFPTEGNQLSGLWFLFFEEPESGKSAGCVGRKSWAKDFWRGGVRSVQAMRPISRTNSFAMTHPYLTTERHSTKMSVPPANCMFPAKARAVLTSKLLSPSLLRINDVPEATKEEAFFCLSD